jgi:hypothetical protein
MVWNTPDGVNHRKKSRTYLFALKQISFLNMLIWINKCIVNHTLWCEPACQIQNTFTLVWSTFFWYEHRFLLKFDVSSYQMYLFSHQSMVWSKLMFFPDGYWIALGGCVSGHRIARSEEKVSRSCIFLCFCYRSTYYKIYLSNLADPASRLRSVACSLHAFRRAFLITNRTCSRGGGVRTRLPAGHHEVFPKNPKNTPWPGWVFFDFLIFKIPVDLTQSMAYPPP